MQEHSLNLMALLQVCLQDRTEEGWQAFLGRLEGILGPGITRRLQRARANPKGAAND